MTHHQAVESMAAERYLLDEMSEIERYRFEEHFFECEECAEAMRLGHLLRTDAKELFTPDVSGTATAPAPARAQGPRWKVAVPWAAAATLALALGYQSIALQAPLPAGDTVAFSPVPLRAASRGQTPVIALPDRDTQVPLMLDITVGRPGEAVAYKLTRADGTALANGAAKVPESGLPLVLNVPVARLRSGGPFVVTVTAPEDSGEPPLEYRFDTSAS
jgi:hypothetical protein